MELQELVERIQQWKTRIAAEESGEIEVQPDDIIDADSEDESVAVAADAMVQADDMEAEPMAEETYDEETAATDGEEPPIDEEELQADEEEPQDDEQDPQVDEEELQADEEEPQDDDSAADAEVEVDVDVDVESEEETHDKTGEIDIDEVEEI